MMEGQSMSPALDLHNQIHSRFHEAFGEPTNSLGDAEQWSLEPSPGAMNIMLFLNGPIEATAEREERVPVSPILSGLALAGGIFLIVAGTRRSTSR